MKRQSPTYRPLLIVVFGLLWLVPLLALCVQSAPSPDQPTPTVPVLPPGTPLPTPPPSVTAYVMVPVIPTLPAIVQGTPAPRHTEAPAATVVQPTVTSTPTETVVPVFVPPTLEPSRHVAAPVQIPRP